MDIKTLSDLTGISVRNVRYVLDHELVPERDWIVDEHAIGRSRVFSNFSGVVIACAAYLLAAGYKRDSVRELLRAISIPRRQVRNKFGLPHFAEVLTSDGPAKVQVADGRFVRWIIGEKADDWLDSWARPISTAGLTPKITVEINVAAIRDMIVPHAQ